MTRIGFGEDIHVLVEGRPLMLGGIEIPYARGLLGHSDADALLHAISDALLGALALGDIGAHFPPSDPTIAGIDSKIILKRVLDMVKEKGYRVVNLDANIVTEAPRLRPHIMALRESVAALLETDVENVSIKAKTNEKCDAVGQGLAIRTNAIVLLEKGE